MGEVWNGNVWATIPSSALGSPGFVHQWAYDAIYEQSSGDALIAFAEGNDLKYAVWNGSSWTTAALVSNYAVLSGGNTPKRVSMAARPGSDQIALAATDNLGKTLGFIWDGSSWGNPGFTVYSGTGGSNTVSAVAYEQQSGRVMFTYGKGFGDAKVYYRIWNGSSLTVEASMTAPSASYGSSDYPNYTTLASDPNSNSLVLGVTTADATTPKTWLNRWDGASWGTSVTGTVTAVSNQFPGVAVAFERNSGDALAVFGNAGSTWVYYKTWTSTVGWLAVQALAVQVNAVPNTLLLESDPNSNKIMLAAQNASGGLYYALWGGTPPFNAAVQLETNTGGATNYQPFVFLWDNVPWAASQVSASSDDAEEVGPGGQWLGGPGNVYLVSSDLELVRDRKSVV